MSELMEPARLAQLMNEYLSAMTLVIRKYSGTLGQYIGDAIMAFRGAPVSDNDHARNAVVTALAMQNALNELNRTLMTRGMPEMKSGIGINTGSMTVGDMGSVVRKAYTVMGDAVNLGSRLESITKQYGVGITVGQSTRHAINDIVFRKLDLVQVKGKEEPIAMFEPLGIEGHLSAQAREELDQWNQLLRYYRQQRWQQAETVLEALDRLQPGCRGYQVQYKIGR